MEKPVESRKNFVYAAYKKKKKSSLFFWNCLSVCKLLTKNKREDSKVGLKQKENKRIIWMIIIVILIDEINDTDGRLDDPNAVIQIHHRHSHTEYR